MTAEELGRMICADGYTTYFNKDANEYAIMAVKSGTILIDASLLEQNANEGHFVLHWPMNWRTGLSIKNMRIHAIRHFGIFSA